MAFCLLPRKAGPARKTPLSPQKGEEWRGVGDAETALGGDRGTAGWGLRTQAFCEQMATLFLTSSGAQLSSSSLLLTSHFLPHFKPFFWLYPSQLFLLLLFPLPLPPSFSLSGKASKGGVSCCCLKSGPRTHLLILDSHLSPLRQGAVRPSSEPWTWSPGLHRPLPPVSHTTMNRATALGE